jgi:hypothetical protein
LESENHKFIHVDDWELIPLQKCGVVFIDHAPAERRQIDIERFRFLADILVVHDTDKMAYYAYDFIGFKHQFTYERYEKSTTLLSYSVDVTKLF